MKFYSLCSIFALFTIGCSNPMTVLGEAASMRFNMLSGEAAQEPATLRVMMIDKTRSASHYRVQALPASWESACLCLQSVDRLTQPRYLSLNRANDFNVNSTKNAAFTTLRPGNYIFQVTLMSGTNGTGVSAAVHTVNLALAGGTNTAITITMKTTDGTGAAGGTVLNSTVSDTTGYVRCNSTNYNSVIASSTLPVIVAGDTLLVAPTLADSSANGSAAVTSGGSGTTTVAALDPGVLSRVVLSYAPASVAPTGPNLVDGEFYLTDWIRNGSEPIRNITWENLSNSSDGGTWPAGATGTRTGSSTFTGSYSWNTTTGIFPLAFIDESALAENYRLIFRYYDNTTKHRLIVIKTSPMAVVAPASIGLTVN